MVVALTVIGAVVLLPVVGLIVVGVRMSKTHLEMYDK